MRKFLSVTLALILLFTMVVPALATTNDTDPTETRTVEAILNEYHEKSFAAEMAEETGNPSVYSREASSGKSLEEETVDELRAAGYEAYNVTASNYDSLETSLNTDFEDLGLEPSGSYIIVISGEETESTGNPNSRTGGEGPDQDIVDGGGSSGTNFVYQYNGNTYQMRYVTVTGDDYTDIVDIDLMATYGEAFVDRLVNTVVTYVIDSAYKRIPFGTIAALFGFDVAAGHTIRTRSMIYTFTSVRVRRYIQVWDDSTNAWKLTTYVEYANTLSECSGRFFDETADNYIGKYEWSEEETVYSLNYSDTDLHKQNAAIAYAYNNYHNYNAGNLTMKFVDENGNTTILGTIYAGI